MHLYCRILQIDVNYIEKGEKTLLICKGYEDVEL